jgi:hypothetical protein
MAEVLGVVASGIAVGQLATSIASGVTKLRKLWNEVQSAPQRIAFLVDELEMLSEVLADTEQAFIGDFAAYPVGRRIIQCCEKAISDLMNLLDDLPTKIATAKRLNRGKAKLKVVLKKDDIELYEKRLDSMIRLLGLASQGALRYVRCLPSLKFQTCFPPRCG